MKKQPEITDATRNAFIDAFIKLYSQKPIEKISIRELTEVAGYNRTTFYHYFEDIYSLYRYIEDFVFSQIKRRVTKNAKRSNFEQEFIATFKQTYDEWKPYLTVLLDDANIARFTGHVKGEMLRELKSNFNLPENSIKVDYLLEFHLSAMLSVISRWVKNQQDMTSEELAALLREMLTNGVLPLMTKYSLDHV